MSKQAIPKFTAGQFADSGYKDGTAADKALFANALMRFLANDCPESQFTERLYNGLYLHFGHIAEYNRQGFYGVWLSTPRVRARFTKHLCDYCQQWRHTRRPDIWSDVQDAFMEYAHDFLQAYYGRQVCAHNAAVEQAERAEYARLRAKYGPHHNTP